MRGWWSLLGAALAFAGCGGQQAKPQSTKPQQLSCRQEVTQAAISPSVPIRPKTGDLVVGPLSFPDGRRLAHMQPDELAAGPPSGSYKIPPVLAPGTTVTIAIAPPARSNVVLENPSSPRGGVVAAIYHACQHAWGFFPQDFRLTHHRIRGCVPMDVTVRGQRPRRVILSLFAGDCPA